MTSKSQEVPDSPEAFSPPVHPHQLEIQEFSNYGLIIDARPLAAFEQDHLPGAVCLPAAWSGDAAPSRLGEAGALVTSEARTGLPYELAVTLSQLPEGSPILVYDDRGGLDSQPWLTSLTRTGWRVDVLPGGWPNYRRWVSAALELLPRTLTLIHWTAPPLSGCAQVIAALAARGEQVVDLVALAHPERLIWGEWLQTARTQEAFETLLLDQLRRMDPERCVHVSGAAALGSLQLPAALRDGLAAAECVDMQTEVLIRATVEAWLAKSKHSE